MSLFFVPHFFWKLANLLNLPLILSAFTTPCVIWLRFEGLPLVQLCQSPWMCGLCVCVCFFFLNATSLGKMALYYPDRRTLASYCADHGKTPSSAESLLINVPFSLITPQLVEAAGCASFPSCSYEDSLSSLITRSVKVSERPRATCESRSFEVTNNENKEKNIFCGWVMNRIRMSRRHEAE